MKTQTHSATGSDPARRLSLAYYQEKGVIFKSPYRDTPDYVCVGKQRIAYGDTFQQAWDVWAKSTFTGKYAHKYLA